MKLVYPHSFQLKNNLNSHLRPLNKKENYQLTSLLVKRAFSQFRKVLNAIVRKHGSPNTLYIELSRDLKNSKKKRDKIQKGKIKKQTPFEWIANRDEDSSDWSEFEERINTANLLGLKKKNLLNITLGKKHRAALTEKDLENEINVLARSLNDNRFLSKFIKNFIENNLAFNQ